MKSAFIGSTGAREIMQAQAINANNLANATTPGFRAAMSEMRSMPVYGAGFPTRVYAGSESPSHNYQPAAIMHTQNPLHAAIEGDGWFAVQTYDGQEGYTRRGDFQTDETGLLMTGAGNALIGQGGPITIPDYQSVTIAKDGTISYTPKDAEPGTMVTLDKIKLVNPELKDMRQQKDGLFVLESGINAGIDEDVVISPNAIEGSNVNPVKELLQLMNSARTFEMNVKIMKKAEENDQMMSRLLQIT